MASENDDLVDPPEWVAEVLVEDALRDYMNDDQLTISSFSIAGGSRNGDNFSSVVSRATFHVSSKGSRFKMSVIVKTMPTWDSAVQFVTKCKHFEKEIAMLSVVLPGIQNILKKIGVNTQLGPKIYYSALEPQKIIIMEDLREDGFVVPDRIKGLTLEQCKTTVKIMSMFHAASLVFFKQRPDVKKIFEQCRQWGIKNQENTREFLTTFLEGIIDKVDSWSNKKWSSKLKQVFKTLPDKMYEINDTKDPKIPQVLNHGDLWTCNLMFKPSASDRLDALEIRFLDFQICFEQSPVLDIMYFIFTSPENKIRFSAIETVMRTYNEQFRKTANDLNLQLNYSYDNMIQDFQKNLAFGLCVFSSLFAIFITPSSENGESVVERNVDEIIGNPKFQDNYLEGLFYFEKMGLFS